jgi:hypothetical protein
MDPTSAFPGLEDLVDVGQDTEIDMRPTLLRVLTDLYLQRPVHTPEDERYYTELALRLIDAADVPTRAALAARLATYPAAPRPLVLRLARDRMEIAAPLLKQSAALTKDDLAEIAAELGGMYAELVAARSLEQPHPHVQETSERDAAREAVELSELFYAAGASERRWILLNLDYAPIAPAEPPVAIQRADIWRLETAALQHNTETVLREMGRTLGLSRVQVTRILSDEGGEPIVVAARAMSVPADVLQRMLLFINAGVGYSVDRVYELSDLFAQLSPASARRMLAIWRAADARPTVRTQHESVPWRTAAESARRALSEVSRRPALAKEQGLRNLKR